MRTLVIGDIHGSLTSLKKSLSKLNYNPFNDRVICVGDYIDGWQHSVQVISYLIELDKNSVHENIFLMGNHDSWLVDAINEGIDLFRDGKYISNKYGIWIRNGGALTYSHYLRLSDDELLCHKKHFFDKLRTYYIDDNKLFLHAGFDTAKGFDRTLEEDPEDLYWNRSLFEKALLFSKIKKKSFQFDRFDKIYIGHTPTVKYDVNEPKVLGNVINVDQGCKANGRLTIWVDDDNTFIQTDEIK